MSPAFIGMVYLCWKRRHMQFWFSDVFQLSDGLGTRWNWLDSAVLLKNIKKLYKAREQRTDRGTRFYFTGASARLDLSNENATTQLEKPKWKETLTLSNLKVTCYYKLLHNLRDNRLHRHNRDFHSDSARALYYSLTTHQNDENSKGSQWFYFHKKMV